MAISAEQRSYLKGALERAISDFYGDTVPTLKEFTRRRRATFIARIGEEVGVEHLRSLIATAVSVRAAKQSALTRLTNELDAARSESSATLEREVAEAKARHAERMQRLEVQYTARINERKEDVRAATEAENTVRRQCYWAAAQAEDDGSRVYDMDVDKAIANRVDAFIAGNLAGDAEGVAVNKRIQEEALAGDIVWLARHTDDARDTILSFIEQGKLPRITLLAWGIEQGSNIISR